MFQKEGETNETGYPQGVDGIWWEEHIFLYAPDFNSNILFINLFIYLFGCIRS